MTLATICRRSDGTVNTHTSPVLSRHSRSSSTYDSSEQITNDTDIKTAIHHYLMANKGNDQKGPWSKMAHKFSIYVQNGPRQDQKWPRATSKMAHRYILHKQQNNFTATNVTLWAYSQIASSRQIINCLFIPLVLIQSVLLSTSLTAEAGKCSSS